MIDRLYYGCGPADTGHYFWLPDSYRGKYANSHDKLAACPWGYSVDGGLQSQGACRQGRCALHRKDGWTALAWWDQSMDTRPGSCSTFCMLGEHDFDVMVAAFRESFPWAAQRMGFELVLAEGEAP